MIKAKKIKKGAKSKGEAKRIKDTLHIGWIMYDYIIPKLLQDEK